MTKKAAVMIAIMRTAKETVVPHPEQIVAPARIAVKAKK